MRRKQITSLLLSSILALSAMATPFTQLPVYAAEAESDAVESEEAGADAGSDKSEADASDEGAGEADGGNQTEGNQSDETGEASGGNSENGNSGTTDGETVADTEEDEDPGEVSGDDNTGENIEAADDEETVEDSVDEDGTVVDEEAAAGETKDEADGDFIFGGVVSATTEGQETVPEENGGESPDDLFADYVEKSFNGELSKTPSLKKRGAKSAGSNLSGIDRAIYNNISACLPQIAAGERASTVFEISVDELGLEKTAWTAEELGIVSVLTLDENGNVALDENGYASISPEAVNAVSERTAFDLSKITRALLADNPYQLYWYEKTQSTTATGFGLTASYDNAIGDYLVGPVGSMSISFPVANEYSAGEYMVDTTIGQAVQTSVANANAIVSQYSSATDYDKLSGYKDEICDLVSYNDAAAGGSVSYGNPWQMIWVFDQDPTTNVVCEGYAKAFKYLCDQSDFSGDISCITVTGTMSGGTGEGPHMWNIVNMEDGKNYLVDVTNSDTGTAGEVGGLFLAPYTSGNVQEGYTFRCNYDTDLHYAYGEETFSIFSTDSLTISDSVYGTTPIEDPLEITKQPQDVVAEDGENVSLSIETNKDDTTYQWQWSADGKSWENCDSEGYNTDTFCFLMKLELNRYHYRCVVTSGESSLISDEAVVSVPVTESGTWGTCDWEISGKGVLTIHSGTGANNYNGTSPWSDYAEQITEIVASEDIILPSGSCALFAIYWVENYRSYSRCTKIDVSGLDTSNVTDMTRLFYGNTVLEHLDLSGFDTSNVTRMPFMFGECQKLQTLDISGFDTHNVTNMEYMFDKCWELTALDVSGFDTSKVVNMSNMFAGCRSLTSLDVSGFHTGLVTNMNKLFFECNGVTNLDVSNFDTSNVTDLSEMFANCVSLQELDVSGFDTSHATKIDHMFQDCWEVPYLAVSGFDTSCATSMEGMFFECHTLTELDVSGFDTSKVTNLGGMFEYCYNLTSLDVSGFDTSSARNMNYMFTGCSKVTELDVSGFNTSNVTEMMNMFFECNSLQNLDLSSFDTSNVTSMINMFGYCQSLQTIDVSSLETHNVKDIRAMFVSCTNLKELNLSTFVVGDETKTDKLCRDCPALTKLILPDSMKSVGELAFDGCPNITVYIHPGSYVEQYCIENGINYVVSGACEVHSWNAEYTIDKAATCTEEGTESIHCSVCGEIDWTTVRVIPIAGHQWNAEYTTDKEATCVEDGRESIHCSVCDEIDWNTIRAIPMKGHSYGDWYVAKEPTCTEAGRKEKACVVCNATIADIIPCIGHQYGNWTVTKEATCTENGSEERICSVCGDKDIEEIIAIGHLWNSEYTVDKEATCTEEGSESIHCSVCGVSDEDSVQAIPATGHAYGDWTVTKEATCTEAGSKEKTCANCDDKITEEIPATGHAWSEWTVVREATEDEEGLETRTCGNDASHTEERTIPKLAHVHNLTKTEAKEASCTVDGNVEFWTCSKCGKVYSDSEGVNEVNPEETVIHAAGHKWNTEYAVDKEATCTEEGSESIHCSVCGVSDEDSVQVVPATGHAYGEWTVVREATCTEAGSKEKVCASCGDKVTEEIPATGHAYGEWTVTKEATCTENGSREKVCGSCGDKVTEEIPAMGHSYGDWEVVREATCTENGSREKVCGSCGDKVTEEILAIGHVWNSEYTVDTEATCTEEGSESIHCSVCGVSDENTVRVIPATGHEYGEWTVVRDATCTEAGSKEKVCASCGDKVTEEIPATGHEYGEWTVVREATCTEAGSKEKVCANCEDKITEEIPATGHAWSEWTVVREATEEEEGLERRTCSNDPSHTEERTIPKLSHVHELIKTEAKEASCTEDGNIEFWTCSKCGRVYSDSEGVNEINPEETVIHAAGHKWNSEYTVDKEATCTEEGSESIHCSVCGVSDEDSVQAIPATGHAYGDWTVTKEATCTEAGSKEKTCANCDDKITEEIPATGHAWSEWTVVREATEDEEGLETRTCGNDASHTEERTIPKLAHVHNLTKTEAKEASCTEDGNIEFWTCIKCGRVYSDSEGVNEINPEETVIHAAGHKWNTEYTVDKEATCTEEGSESLHCSVCGVSDENSVQVVPATGHAYGDWTVVREATCTEAGSKEKVCANCGDKITEEIPATGHSYGDWTVTKEATCTEAGSKEKVCANCGDKITEEIPAKGHAYGDWTVTKEATCTEAGSKEKVCANCGDKITEEIPAAGHQWNETYTIDVAPTYTEEGVESIHCSVCGEIKEGSERAVAKLRKPVSMLEISGIVDKNYNGKAQTQTVVVMDGDTTLVNGTDYTVSYKSNTNAGTASVIITGIGSYTGSVTKEFTIKKIANTITAKSFTRTYSTKGQSFGLGVKVKSGTPTYKSSSKSVTVSKAGKVTVKAKFMGKVTIKITAPASANYTATTKKITITVNPTKAALVSVTSPSAGKMTVKWKKNAVGTGYQIQYSTSSKFTSPKSVTITKNSTLTRTIGSLAKGKKYYVRIRTYKTVGSTKFYSGWSAAKAVTVKK